MFVRRLVKSAATSILRFSIPGRRFAADAEGATAVEFGIVAFPFFMVLCAIFESAFLLFNQGNLENATYAASRQLLTGNIQNGGFLTGTPSSTDPKTYFKNLVCQGLWSSFSCGNIRVNVSAASDFTTASGNTTTSAAVCSATDSGSPFGAGASGNIVIVRVCYPYPLYFNRLMTGFSSSTMNIMATTVFKAENY